MCEVVLSLIRRNLNLKPLIQRKVSGSFNFRGLAKLVKKPHTAADNTSTFSASQSTLLVKEARETLQSLFDINESEVIKIVPSYKKIPEVSKFLIPKNYNICTDEGLDKEVLLKYPFLLFELNLSEKIAILKTLPISLLTSIPLGRLSMQRLHSYVKLRPHKLMQIIQDLARFFKITLEQSCEIVSKKPFLFNKSVHELEELMEVLYEYGFSKKDVLKDLWIFKYGEDCIRNRLEFVRDHDIVHLKSWMIRCPEETLYKHIKRVSENRVILGENSVTQYLSEKLNCSDSMAKKLIERHPQLQNKSLLKLSVMIDFLYRRGFTSTHICRVPKILVHSVKTTEARLKQIEDLGKKLDSLYILTKSQKQYLQHIENFKGKGNVESEK